jgi:hypothetical protein
MNLLKKWWFWAIVVVVITYFGFLIVMNSFFLRYGSPQFVIGEIDAANYCDAREKCVNLGAKCPFGCNIYVNEKEADRIESMLRSYPEDCIYDCQLCPGVECVNNKCVEICGEI